MLNALTYPKRNKDFSCAVFMVAPGLTVKERLQMLLPSEGSYYDEFNLYPFEALRQKLNQAEALIQNWHTPMPLKEAERSVVKKGRGSDEVFTRRVLGKLAAHKDIIVINDEAHNAYRKPPEAKISKKAAAEQGIDVDEATRWIKGLDRIHKTPAHPALLRPLGHALRANRQEEHRHGAVRLDRLGFRAGRRD